jgi:hypothetical protein
LNADVSLREICFQAVLSAKLLSITSNEGQLILSLDDSLECQWEVVLLACKFILLFACTKMHSHGFYMLYVLLAGF